MKHPYAEILHAIADGVEVESRRKGIDTEWVKFRPENTIAPFVGDHREWRIKPQPKTGTFWVNVYPDGPGCVWGTRVEADASPYGKNRIACIEVQWTEGEGL
jgi:hypothetical protein